MLPIADGTAPADGSRSGEHPLKGKRIYIPPMAYGSARAFASAFRAIGLEAEPTPPSDHRTRELGARYTSGDECYPAKVTVGDFMKVLERPDDRPVARGALHADRRRPVPLRPVRALPAAHAGCQRLSATWRSSRPPATTPMTGWATLAKPFVRTGWRALLCADLLQKMLLIYRPYEERRGDTEACYEESLDDLCRTLENDARWSPACNCWLLRDSLVRCRDRFRKLARARPMRSHPLIGIVGEIFCRLNTFSNENLVRCLEEYGAEAWLSDIVEWIWYTNSEHFRKLKLTGRIWTAEALGAWVRKTRAEARRARAAGAVPRGFRGPRGAGHLRDPGMRPPLPAARRRVRRDGAERRQGGLPGQARARPGSSTSARSPA